MEFRYWGSAKQLKSLIIANEIEDVIIAMPSADGKTIGALWIRARMPM